MADMDDEYAEADVARVVLSADDGEAASSMKEEEALDFPVLYGLDVEAMRERLGLYVRDDDQRTHVQPAQFILDPKGRVRLACYSSGAVGRVSAEEALAVVRSARG